MRTGADDKRYARLIASRAVYGLDVTDIDYEIRKTPGALVGEEIVVFVTYLPQAVLKEHTAHYLRALKAVGFTVILVVVVDELSDEIGDFNESAVDGLIVRFNHGYDFSAWAHAMKIWPDLWGARLLLFANDSVYGPAESGAFLSVIDRIRKSEADVLGLTESCERGVWHIQSYFVALKPRALGSVACQEFWKNVRSLPSKQLVIDSYELGFVSSLKHAGLNCEVLFPHQQLVTSTGKNPTLFQWRQLLENGFPFVKVQALRDDIPGIDKRDWQEILGRHGFPVSVMESRLRSFDSRDRAGFTASVNRMPTEKLRASGKLAQEDLKVSFIGPWNYASGLGVASRGYLSALWHSKLRVNLHPIHRPFHIHGRVTPMLDVNDFDGPCDICIVHLNPDAWPSLLDDNHRRVLRKARYRVGLWVWELPEVPQEWLASFKDVDAVWSPSEYCRASFVTASETPVSVLPHVVTAPYDLMPPNLSEKLGLPSQRQFILYIFDGASYLVRKNPHALIRAFAASGLAQRGWSLILKTKNLFDIPEEGQRLEQMVQSTPEVYLINRVLSPRDHHGILALCQVYASPHASEGFGLTIAEAMAAGKVVVATDHGGSRDFLDSTCGFPVKWSEQVLERDHGHYRRGGVWAAVDEEDLASALKEAAEASMDPARTVSRAAARRIRGQLSAQAVADRMHELCQELAG
jgi:glycosyltransferase involved in cell wall biosynthesis